MSAAGPPQGRTGAPRPTGGQHTSASALLPPQVHVFVRDWLSANHVLLKSRDGNVLIDTGYVRHLPLTLALLESARGLGSEPLAAIVNTHCHSDHMGGNAAIAERYGCPIYIPQGEAAAVEAWDTRTLLLDYAGQHAERFTPDFLLPPGHSRVWGDLDWELIAAPGHDNGALMFYNPEHGILISGDALWRYGFGFVMPPEIDPIALPSARATLDRIAQLKVRVLIPGHGEPFAEVDAALARAYKRLESFEREPASLARHAVKVIFAFVLLDRQRMAVAQLPDFLAQTGIFRDFNAQFLELTPEGFASFLVKELLAAGAIERHEGWLTPASRP